MNHPKEFAEGLSIGIIMDGNGRWAKQRGLPRTAGHKKGAAVFQDIANYRDLLRLLYRELEAPAGRGLCHYEAVRRVSAQGLQL